MDSGMARVAQMKDPRKVRIMLGNRLIWSPVWDRNPRIAGPNQEGDFNVIYGRDPRTNMRPYHKQKTTDYWVYDLSFRPQVGEIYFAPWEVNFSKMYHPELIVEPNIKAKASPNKQWGWERWQAFVHLAKKEGYEVSQLGPRDTPVLNGVRLIETESFRHACAVLGRAKAFVGGEGGLHHAAAALNVHGVVVFGGFTPVELTGYPIHRNLGVSLGEACGMRIPCKHCDAEMAKITPEQVLEELTTVLCNA